MQKHLILFGAAIAAAFAITGCASVSNNNGALGPANFGVNFYSDVKANSCIPQYAVNGSIVKKGVTAQATLKSYFTCVNLGDISYATLKADALKQAPGATELTNVKMDYAQKTICGVSTYTVTMTADAIK